MSIRYCSFFKSTLSVCILFMFTGSYCMEYDFSDDDDSFEKEFTAFLDSAYDDESSRLTAEPSQTSRSFDQLPKSKVLTLPKTSQSSSFDTLPEVKKRAERKPKHSFNLKSLFSSKKSPKPPTIFDYVRRGDTDSFGELLRSQGPQDEMLTALAQELTRCEKNREEYHKRVGLLEMLLSSLQTTPLSLDHANKAGQTARSILERSDRTELQTLVVRLDALSNLIKLHENVSEHVNTIVASLQLNASENTQAAEEAEE